MYYKDFPSSHMEIPRQDKGFILKPRMEILAHQNSIFDLLWIKGDTQIVSASAEKNCKIIDAETGAEI